MDINYENDLYIDETSLDVEWLEQPQLMLKYTREMASTRRERDRLKEKLSVTRAQIAKDIRSDPDKYEMPKVTESAIQEEILMQPKYQVAVDDINDAEFEYQMALGAVQAVEQRKSALENLIKLHGLQYFAGPKVPRDLPAEVKRSREKEITSAANAKMVGSLARKK